MTGRKRAGTVGGAGDSGPASEPEPLSPAVAALVAVLGPLRRPFDPVKVAGRMLEALAGVPGPVEAQVRTDVHALGKLDGARASYAQVAYRLARSLDVEDGEGTVAVAGAARELRAALIEVWKGVRDVRRSDAVVAQLATPVVQRAPVPTAVRDEA